MAKKQTIHIVAADSRVRAQLARIAYDIGRHAELYENCRELAARRPKEGLALVYNDAEGGRCGRLVRALADRGCWLPIVVASSEPALAQVTGAMKAGALDYLAMPISAETLEAKLGEIEGEAAGIGESRRGAIVAKRRIDRLSKREREVLDLLAIGQSNKLIARELGISPRTVEIHRHNMMQKLDCAHAAAAVRMSVEAKLEAGPLAAARAKSSRRSPPVSSSRTAPQPGFDTLCLN